jgi:uncharacterized protein YhaN
MDTRTDDTDPHREIARLEDRIEQLAQKLEGCRKYALAARLAMALGGVLLLALIVGIARADLALPASIAALLGGIVLAGSNQSTAKEAAAELAEAEAERNALIGRIDLREVRGQPTLQ